MKAKWNAGVVLGAVGGLALGVQAQTNFYWTNAVGNLWSTAPNVWTNSAGSVAPLAGGSNDYTLTFVPTNTYAVTNNIGTPGFLLNQLVVNAGTVTVFAAAGTNLVFTNNTSGLLPQILQNSGGALTLNLGLNLATNLTFAGTGTGAVNVNSNLSGAGGLIMGGGYALTLAASNSYGGSTTITNGTLKVGNYRALGTNKTVTVSGTGTLDLNNVDLRTNYAYNVTISGAGVGSNGAVVNNSGAGLVNFGLNNLTLAGDATIGGAQRWGIQNGLDLAGFRLTKVGAGQVSLNAGVVTAGNLDINAGTISYEGSVMVTGVVGVTTLNTGGTLLLYATVANNMTRPIVANGGTLNLGQGGAGAGTASMPLTLQSNLTLNVGGTYTLNGPIGESGGSYRLTKIGAATLTLTNSLTYTGGTLINAGNIQFNTPASVPATGLITLNAGGALQATGAYATIQGWLNDGRIATNSAGAIALTASSASAIDFSAGNYASLSLGAVGTVTNSGVITPFSDTYRLGGGGGTLVLANDLALTGSRNVLINNLAANGTVILAGSNDYTGTTTILNSYTGTPATVASIYNSAAFGSSSVLFSNLAANTANYLGVNFYGGSGSLIITNPITIDSTTSGRMRFISVTGSNIVTGPITLKSASAAAGFEGSGLANNGSWTILGDIDGTQLNGGNMYLTGTGIGAGGYVLGNVNLGTGGILMEKGGGTRSEWYLGAPGKTYAWNFIRVNGILHLLTSGVLPANSWLESTHTNDLSVDLHGTTQQVAYINTATFPGNLITNYSTIPAALIIAGSASNQTVFTGTIAENTGGGTISLVLGGGTVNLVGANSYSGGTLVTNGTMFLVSTTNTIGTGGLTVGPDTGLGTTAPLDQNFLDWISTQVSGAPQVVLLGANSSSNLTFGGSLANAFLGAAGGTFGYYGLATWGDTTIRLGGGSSALIYSNTLSAGTSLLVGPLGGNAASVVILTNAANNPDSTTVQSGTLQLGNNGAAAAVLGGNAITISNNATLAFKFASGTGIYSNAITGGGSVNQAGVGPVFLVVSNSYGGGTLFTAAGRIGAGDDNALGTGTITFAAAGLLSATGTVARTLANNLIISNNITLGNSTDSGTLTLNGTVNLGGATRAITSASPVSINGVIGNGGLNKAGSSTLVLGATNTYAGGTLLSAGTLSIGDYTNLPASGPVTFSGGLLQITGTIVTNLDPYAVNWTNFSGGFDINSAANTFTVNTNLSAPGTFIKTGPGTLLLDNSTLVITGGGLQVNQGTLIFKDTSVTNTANVIDYVGKTAGDAGTLILQGASVYLRTQNQLQLGSVAGSKGVMVITNDAAYINTGTDWLQVGNGGTGILYMAGGSISNRGGILMGDNLTSSVGAIYQTAGSIYAGAEFDMAYQGTGSAYGYYQLSGGSLANSNWQQVGRSGMGVMYQFGGTNINLNAGAGFVVANNSGGISSTGVIYFAGGYASANRMGIGWNSLVSANSRGEVTITTNATVNIGATGVFLNQAGTNFAVLNLNGGTLQTPNIYKNVNTTGSWSVVNFNGTLVQINGAGNGIFMGANANATGKFAVDGAYVWGGGAIIDSSNFTATISQNLLAPTGQGVTGIPWGGDISGYVGAPYVGISGGSGTGATAVALFDYTSGSVTGVVITSAGIGYQPGDAVTLTLMRGGNTNYMLGTATLGPNTSGGLTKLGSGTLILSGSNTFTGPINLVGGGLLFSNTNALPATVTTLFIPFATSVGVGYPLNQAFLNIISNQSAGTVGLGADSSNPLDFTSLTNVSLGAIGGTWTNRGAITPLDTTYRLGGGGGTLVIPTVLTDVVAGATSLLAFGSGSGGTVVLAATNTYTGGTTLAGGELSIGSYSNLPIPGPLTFSGGFLQITGGVVSNLNPYSVNWSGFDGGFDIVSNGFVVTVATNLSGSGALMKLGAGTLLLVSNNAYAGSTTIGGGVLQVGNGGAFGSLGTGPVTNTATLVFNRSDAYTVTNLFSGSGTNVLLGGGTLTAARNDNLPVNSVLVLGSALGTGNFNLNGYNQTVASLVAASTNTSQTNTITIGSGQTLTINGAGGIFVGYDNSAVNPTYVATTRLTMNGGGALVVTNTSAIITIGKAQAIQTNASNTATLDLSGLASVTLGSSNGAINEVRIGYGLYSTGLLMLSDTNNLITAAKVSVGHANGANAGTGTLILGAGTNVLAVDALQIGFSKASGTLKFAAQTPGSPGTVIIGGKTGTTADITIGSKNGTATASSPTGILDLRGHLATVTAGTVTIGLENGNSTGTETGNLYFDGGTFTVSNLNMAVKSTASAVSATAALMVSGGVFTVNSGGSFSLASQTGGGTASGTLNLYGGTFNANVDILDGGGTATSTINLNGGTLDMMNNNIGSSGTKIDAFNLQSGTLQNLNQFNGGAPLVKTTGGTLVLAGANGYTGGTLINAGTLVASNAQALGTGPVAITNALLRLAQSLTINSNLSGNAGAWIDLGMTGTALTINQGDNSTFAGAMTNAGGLVNTGAGILTLSGVSTYVGNTVISNGTIQLGVNGALPSATALFVDTAGTLDIVGFSQTVAGLGGAGKISSSLGSAALTLNSSTTNTFLGTLTGPGNVTLTGGGTLNLPGTNSFSGSTIVSNASYYVNGLHNGGMITVLSNGVVGGNGPISGLLVGAGGTYAPGNSLATQLVSSLTLTNAGLLALELGNNANDQVIVTNSLTIAGGQIKLSLATYTFNPGVKITLVDWTTASGFTPADPAQWFTLNDAGGPNNGLVWTNGMTLAVLGGASSTNLFKINYDDLANGVAETHGITLTAVPEPGTVSLLGLVGVAWLVRRIRRRKPRNT